MSDLNNPTSRLNSATSHLNNLTSRLNSATSHLNSPTSRLNSATSHLNSPTSCLNSMTSHLNNLTRRLNSLTSHLNSVTSHLNAGASQAAGRFRRRVRGENVFDLLDVACRFKQESRDEILFDACGTGSVLDDLKLEVKAAGVEDSFLCHGYCNRAEMQAMLGRSHVVVVPTTSDFVEGFNQVVVEAVLARRPVITSSVCPALSYVRDAIVEVAPDDRRGYGDAILKLFQDVEFFDKKRHACTEYQSQFYDLDRSWGAALRRIIEAASGEMRP